MMMIIIIIIIIIIIFTFSDIVHLVNLFYSQLDPWFLQLFLVNFVSGFSCLYISCVFLWLQVWYLDILY